MSVYAALDDPDVIRRVNVHFYSLVYADPWLGQFFRRVDEAFLISQQTDFITGALGGPKCYSGRTPAFAHPHIDVTDELFDHRSSLLQASFEAVGAPEALRVAWLRVDEAHRGAIVKKDVSDCRPRWRNDAILSFEEPGSRRSAG